LRRSEAHQATAKTIAIADSSANNEYFAINKLVSGDARSMAFKTFFNQWVHSTP